MARILVIDDDRNALSLIQMVLSKGGHEVVTARDGPDGLKKAFAQPPDLAIVDVMMPMMNGYEVCRRLRADERTAHIPILVFTARTQEVDRQASLEAGANAYLAKPVMPAELLREVEALLAAAPAPPQPPREAWVVVLFSLRGGVGVTTLAVNLAVTLAQQGEGKVPLLDLSETGGHAALMLNLHPKHTLMELARSGKEINREEMESCLVDHSSGVRLLAAAPGPLTPGMLPGVAVEVAVKVLKEGHPYIVVDVPSSLDEVTRAALSVADEIWLVLSPEVASLQAAVFGLQVLRGWKLDGKAIQVVVNQVGPHLKLKDEIIAAALKKRPVGIFPFEPAQGQAINQGVPLALIKPLGALVTTMLSLADGVKERAEQRSKAGT